MAHNRNNFVPSGNRGLDQMIDNQIDNLRAAEFESAAWHAAENQMQGIRSALACIDPDRYADCVISMANVIVDIHYGRQRQAPVPGSG